jgi:hypothetical protein
MLALDQYESECCNRCGGHLPETTSAEHDFNNFAGEAVYAPMPDTPVQCHKCSALHRSEQETAALSPQHPQAMIHAVHLVPRR